MATQIHAAALPSDTSWILANRRRPSQPNVRSTTQRLGNTLNPPVSSVQFTSSAFTSRPILRAHWAKSEGSKQWLGRDLGFILGPLFPRVSVPTR